MAAPDDDTAARGAGSLPWWDKRSRLEPLAAVLDPSAAGRKNALIDRVHHASLRRALAGRRLGRVLDFGCGTGRLSDLLLPRSDRVAGVDISEQMVARARELHRDARLEFTAYDGARLPFADGEFDTALSSLVLQMYCDDPERFRAVAGDLARVLRPGGTLWLVERAVPEGAAGWTPARWRHELAACGLALEGVRPIRRGVPSPLFRLALRRVVPECALDRVAAADAALTALRGVRGPYTECLMRAVRE